MTVSAAVSTARPAAASGPARLLVLPSAALFAGTAVARLLGLFFSIACAHLLAPRDFGQLAYALTMVTFAAVLLQNAPGGLARYLARHHAEPEEQERYLANWIAVVLALLAVSGLLAIPLAAAAGLRGWLVVGLLANVVGVSVVATTFAVYRGLERFSDLAAFYCLANLLQLVAVLLLGIEGIRSVAICLVVYGLSSLPALAAVLHRRPLGVRLRMDLVRRATLRKVSLFAGAQSLQYAFYTVWLGADLVLLVHSRASALVGSYAAAKTMVVALGLGPSAISAVLTPRVAQAHGRDLRRLVGVALLLVAALVVPGVAAYAVLGRDAVLVSFGRNYLGAVEPLTWLAIGMGVYCFCVALENLMIGLGRARIPAAGSGCAAAVTIASGLVLVPRLAMTGAALAFTSGAVAELAFMAAACAIVLGPAAHNRTALALAEA